MVDQYLIGFGIILVGGILGVIIPYLFKCMDNETKFSFSYLYGMFISMGIAAAALVPETIDLNDGQVIVSLVFTGIGIQTVTNMVTTKVRKNTVKQIDVPE